MRGTVLFCNGETSHSHSAWLRFLRVWLVMLVMLVVMPGLGEASGDSWACNLGAVSGLVGCDSRGAIEDNLLTQQYDAALEKIEKEADAEKNRVLYLLNKGMVLRMKRDFAGSNVALEEAKAEMDRLYTVSISETGLRVVLNDGSRSYSGDNYERVLLHLYKALNYLELDQPDSARVEVLQIDVVLRKFAEKIPDSKNIEGAFTDAFTLYLAGLIYDDRKEWSDAMISYRNAYTAYKKSAVAIPAMLKNDLMRLARKQGLMDELKKYQAEFPGLQDNKGVAPDQGELVFVLNSGLAPFKREKMIDAVETVTGSKARIGLPSYESRPSNIVAARITVNDQQATTELMEDVDSIARKNLDSQMETITNVTKARVFGRKVAGKKADAIALVRNEQPSFLNTLFQTGVKAAELTESADTRSWYTLPSHIQLARLSLPPGNHGVKVELLGANQQVVATQNYPLVAIKKAKKTFLTQHWVSKAQKGASPDGNAKPGILDFLLRKNQ